MSRSKVNLTNTVCIVCKNKLVSGKALREYDNKSNWTGNWLCRKCYNRHSYEPVKKVEKNFKYNLTNTCDECKTEKLVPGNARREYDISKGFWTGRWLCEKCNGIYRYYGTLDKDKILEIKSGYRNRCFYHNKTNTCDRCGICFDKINSNPLREYNEVGDWTGKWICGKCHAKYDPNSANNLKKMLAHRRTGNLNNVNLLFADNCEELTCRWRGVKNLNLINNNFESPIDHTIDKELGIVQTKGRRCNISNIYEAWNFDTYREHDKEFDHIICYCTSEDGNLIDKIYIFPKEEILKRHSITIYKNFCKHISSYWYEKYRFKDEEELKKINIIWKEIIEER